MKRVVALVLLTATSAQAGEVAGKSAIESVVVYPDGALVTRTLKVDLSGGDNTVVAGDFPLGLDASSLRVEGEAAGKLTIGAIEARPPKVVAPKLDEARIEQLQDERAALDGRIAAANARLDFVGRYVKQMPFGSEKGTQPVSEVRAAFVMAQEETAAQTKEVAEARLKQREVDRKIAELRNQVASEPVRKLEVRIDVAAAAPTSAVFKVGYMVRNARWAPVYDARLSFDGGKDGRPALELVRRAEVVQQSGESWGDVALSVSTMRTARSGAARELAPWMVGFRTSRVVPVPGAAASVGGEAASPTYQQALRDQDAQRADMARRGGASAVPTLVLKSQSMSNVAGAPVVAPAPPPPLPAMEAVAEVENGGYQAVYRVAGKVSVPANEGPKSFRIGAESVSPDLLVKATPKFDDAAFLEASFKHAEDAPLLPGQVLLFRDGAFVGKARMPLAAREEKVRLGFGVDEKVKVVRTVVKKSQEASGGVIYGYLATVKREDQEFKIVVRNGHDRAVKVRVEDQMPVSETEDIKVEMSPSTTPPTERDAGDRRGVVAWEVEPAAGEAAKDILFGWKITWPKDKELSYQ